MPVFELKTNIAEEKIPKNLAINLVSVVADALHKPAEYVVVGIKGSCNLSFGLFNFDLNLIIEAFYYHFSYMLPFPYFQGELMNRLVWESWHRLAA